MTTAAFAGAPAGRLVRPVQLQRCLRLLPCRCCPPRASILSSPWFSPVRGMCHVAVQALKRGDGAVDVIPVGAIADKNVAEAVTNIVELARRASLRRSIMHTNFLTPPVVKEASKALEKLADVKAVSQGGYPQAERCRLSVGHPDDLDAFPNAVAAVREKRAPKFSLFQNSLISLYQIWTSRTCPATRMILLLLLLRICQVGNVPVSCVEMPLLALEYEPPRTKSFKTIEASLRIDALASAGFKISRSKLVGLISNGDVRVNWSPVTKNATTLQSGDLISVSGQGRLKQGKLKK